MNTETKSMARLKNLFLLAINKNERMGFLLAYTNGRTTDLGQLSRYECEELADNLSKTVTLAAPNQIKKLQCLYRDLNLTEVKKELLMNYTDGRTDSTAGLTTKEATLLIKHLAGKEPKDRMRKTILSYAYQAGIIYGESEVDKKINVAKLNLFLKDRGRVKKAIDEQTFEELKETMAQMAAIVKGQAKTADNKYAQKITNELLNEMKLTIKK